MRTTLTLDDDLAGLLKQRARELGIPFKEAVPNAVPECRRRRSQYFLSRSSIALLSWSGHEPRGNVGDRSRQCEDDMEIRHGQEFSLAIGQPFLGSGRPGTLGNADRDR
jgi:hypothetical protein